MPMNGVCLEESFCPTLEAWSKPVKTDETHCFKRFWVETSYLPLESVYFFSKLGRSAERLEAQSILKAFPTRGFEDCTEHRALVERMIYSGVGQTLQGTFAWMILPTGSHFDRFLPYTHSYL